MPIRKLQEFASGMIDLQTGIGFVTSIQIKLKNEADGDLVRDKLRAIFPGDVYQGQHLARQAGLAALGRAA